MTAWRPRSRSKSKPNRTEASATAGVAATCSGGAALRQVVAAGSLGAGSLGADSGSAEPEARSGEPKAASAACPRWRNEGGAAVGRRLRPGVSRVSRGAVSRSCPGQRPPRSGPRQPTADGRRGGPPARRLTTRRRSEGRAPRTRRPRRVGWRPPRGEPPVRGPRRRLASKRPAGLAVGSTRSRPSMKLTAIHEAHGHKREG